ncbi:XP_014788451.1PREDICTED: uncharacterized protein LOC106882323 [Octopus vulgaris]|uniref:XP_014788451.1PREDICTED: uncharacterized protein LOC106882323 n=1 Tax=Octopus vulgaris TaxID=6645 RepID=A0AA36APF1_OCTVU|nr:XP_014788451.1PREDICTED: uncharacterized protein LOC106882323 [Octopus vulgaris]
MKTEVIQKKLLFALGSAVTKDLINNTIYKKHFLENFDFATLENEMNWHHNEPEQSNNPWPQHFLGAAANATKLASKIDRRATQVSNERANAEYNGSISR